MKFALSARAEGGDMHVQSATATFARTALQLEADLINDVLAVSTSTLAALPPPPPRDTVSAPLWPPPLTPPFPPTSAHHAAAHSCMFAFPSGGGGYECMHVESLLHSAETASAQNPVGAHYIISFHIILSLVHFVFDHVEISSCLRFWRVLPSFKLK